MTALKLTRQRSIIDDSPVGAGAWETEDREYGIARPYTPVSGGSREPRAWRIFGHSGPACQLLAEHGLAGVTFERRRDALAALAVALAERA